MRFAVWRSDDKLPDSFGYPVIQAVHDQLCQPVVGCTPEDDEFSITEFVVFLVDDFFQRFTLIDSAQFKQPVHFCHTVVVNYYMFFSFTPRGIYFNETVTAYQATNSEHVLMR